MKIIYKQNALTIAFVVPTNGVVDSRIQNIPIVVADGQQFVDCNVADIADVEAFTNSTRDKYFYDPSTNTVHTLHLKPLDAYDRLTAAERMAIRALALTNPVVEDWLHRFDIVAYQNTPFEIGVGSNWHGGMAYLNSLTPKIITDARLIAVTA